VIELFFEAHSWFAIGLLAAMFLPFALDLAHPTGKVAITSLASGGRYLRQGSHPEPCSERDRDQSPPQEAPCGGTPPPPDGAEVPHFSMVVYQVILSSRERGGLKDSPKGE
jgi:hypothetical protein